MLKFEFIKVDEIDEVCDMVKRTCRNSAFANFYPSKYFYCTRDEIIQKTENGHFYVAKDGEKIVGCGTVTPYQDSATEVLLSMIFVEPSYQEKGIGKKIVEHLENDEFAQRANRIEIHSAMNAIPFYRKLGYEHKNGDLCYADGHFDLEKFINHI